MKKQCISCGESFEAHRSDAKTCSDSCRAKLSRRKRDPGIGSRARRERQREGLDKKYLYPLILEDLQKAGLVPTKYAQEANADEGRPRDPDSGIFGKTPPGELRSDMSGPRRHSRAVWSPADGWWKDEPMPSLPARRDAYLAAEARRRRQPISSGGYSSFWFYDQDGTFYGAARWKWIVVDGSPWPIP